MFQTFTLQTSNMARLRLLIVLVSVLSLFLALKPVSASHNLIEGQQGSTTQPSTDNGSWGTYHAPTLGYRIDFPNDWVTLTSTSMGYPYLKALDPLALDSPFGATTLTQGSLIEISVERYRASVPLNEYLTNFVITNSDAEGSTNSASTVESQSGVWDTPGFRLLTTGGSVYQDMHGAIVEYPQGRLLIWIRLTVFNDSVGNLEEYVRIYDEVLGSLTFEPPALMPEPSFLPTSNQSAVPSVSVPLRNADRFLTLPFRQHPDMRVQQGWIYTWGDPHRGIDYIQGELDTSATWNNFEVLAAHDGFACGNCASGPTGSQSVWIRHQVDNRTYYSYYGHLAQIEATIPLGSQANTVFVRRGQRLGVSGDTGTTADWIHLHFETKNATNVPIDPYDLYLSDRSRYYPGGSAYNGMGQGHLFTTAPPSYPNALNSQVDVSLIIDSSGSMSSSDPSGMRKEGAKVFVDTAQNGDGIAVVDFATTAFARWPMTPLTNDRTAVKAAIDQIPSNGSSTNIGGGLQVGYDQLQAGNADHQKAAVLMTDGQHNAGTNPSAVVPLYQAAGWPVYTIGLGSGVNQQMLQQIADATGGSYTHLSDPNDLIRVYFEIVGAILGGTTIANQQNLIQQGETVQATVAVPANQSQVTFLVNWPGSRVDTTLTTPSGQQITPQTVDPNVYHAQGLTYELYRITNPESGDWTVTMYGADLPPDGEMVELTVNAIGQTAMAPTANAGGPYTGVVGQPVLFDGSASYDPDGSITLYEWDFDSDGTFDYSSSDPTATHTYSAPYNGTVILQVTDNSGTTATGAASVTIEVALVCNDAPEGFDAGARAAGWTVLNGVAGGPEWTDLTACGPYPNWTNGTGNAACVSAGNIIVQPFDSELRTPVFSLAGYAEAYLNYQANYHNWASQDQLDLDISSDGGVTWTTLRSWQEDHGAPFGLPGENVTINLMPYLGESNLMVRWRYYAPTGQGLGYYAQLDDVRLNCTEIPPTAVTVSEMTSATSQSPLPAATLPLAGLPAAVGLAFVAVAWLRRKR